MKAGESRNLRLVGKTAGYHSEHGSIKALHPLTSTANTTTMKISKFPFIFQENMYEHGRVKLPHDLNWQSTMKQK